MYVNDNLLSHDDLSLANVYLSGRPWTYGWKSNDDIGFGHWNADITQTLKTNPTDVSDRLPFELVTMWNKINHGIFGGKAMLTRCYANQATHGIEGYIHTDTTRQEDHTVVVYMNETWDTNWGGETVLYTPDLKSIAVSYIPQYGRIVVFPGIIPHKASAVSRICPVARMTLMFKVSIDPKPMEDDESKLIGFLDKIGAGKMPHKNGTLLDHLYRCYRIVKDMKMPAYIALAAGLHSVYGTNKFNNALLDFKSKDVEETFGHEVDELVRLFSTIDRPKVLEEGAYFLGKNLFALRCIETANLYDQGELLPKDYPNLLKFVEELIK
jgi:SM-20-related protein